MYKHVGMLSFISRQSNKKISVIELFPVRGKQKNTSSNNFHKTNKHWKIVFDHMQMSKHVGCTQSWLVALIV